MGDNRPSAYLEGKKAIYRASSSGYCVRALVAATMNYDAVYQPDRKALLDRSAREGNVHEEAVMNQLVADGYRIVETQTEVNIPVAGAIVRGHTDGIVEDPDGKHLLVEVKSMSTKQYAKWVAKRWGNFPGYAGQIACYMRAHPHLDVLYVVKRREDGLTTTIIIPAKQPPIPWANIVKKVATAERWRKKNQLPPCDIKQWGCPFFYLHEEEETDPLDDDQILEELEKVVQDWLMVRAAEREMEMSTKWRKEELGPKILDLMSGRSRVEVPSARVARVQTRREWYDIEQMKEDLGEEVMAKYRQIRSSEYPRVTPNKKPFRKKGR